MWFHFTTDFILSWKKNEFHPCPAGGTSAVHSVSKKQHRRRKRRPPGEEANPRVRVQPSQCANAHPTVQISGTPRRKHRARPGTRHARPEAKTALAGQNGHEEESLRQRRWVEVFGPSVGPPERMIPDTVTQLLTVHSGRSPSVPLGQRETEPRSNTRHKATRQSALGWFYHVLLVSVEKVSGISQCNALLLLSGQLAAEARRQTSLDCIPE